MKWKIASTIVVIVGFILVVLFAPKETPKKSAPPLPAAKAIDEPSPGFTARTEPVAPTPIPTLNFERPCEGLETALVREQAKKEINEFMDRANMNPSEREHYLRILYDAQENTPVDITEEEIKSGKLEPVGPEDPRVTTIVTYTEELQALLGWARYEKLKNIYGPLMKAVRSRALRTGHEVITDKDWFKARRLKYDCPEAAQKP